MSSGNQILEELVVSKITLPVSPLPPASPLPNFNYRPEKAELLRSMECPICRSVPAPMTPVVNCSNGHFSCHQCRPRLAKCPLCSANFTQMRNYPLEQVLASPAFDCDFAKDGCSIRNVTLSEYDNHVRCCPFSISSNMTEVSDDLEIFSQENMNPPMRKDEIKCMRCGSLNSSRKLKCHHCQTSFRPPTPVCGRSPLRSVSENEMHKNQSRFYFR